MLCGEGKPAPPVIMCGEASEERDESLVPALEASEEEPERDVLLEPLDEYRMGLRVWWEWCEGSVMTVMTGRRPLGV